MDDNLFSVETNISPKHLPAFMVNWAISYKCNLDCSYCIAHDNSLKPVPFDDCKKSADFILKYVDLLMSMKPAHEKRVAINLIGGEPFAHPRIYDILNYLHNEFEVKYKNSWKLSVCITTNGIIGKKLMQKCIGLIDLWTISYHTETTKKQKNLTLNTIQELHKNSCKCEVRVMAPADTEKFKEAKEVHSLLISQGINALIKPIHETEYTKSDSEYFKIFWKTDSKITDNYSTANGITCCSDRPLVLNQDRKNKTNFIPMNNFKDWYCALNWHFLYVDHLLKVYHNMSCHVSYNSGKIEPIGTINEYGDILKKLEYQILEKNIPVIKCPQNVCIGCGMCASKARSKDTLIELMKTRLIDTSVLKFID